MTKKDFDKIWCLTSCNFDRLTEQKKEFNRIGLDVNFYYNPQIPPSVYGMTTKYMKTKHYIKIFKRGNKNVFRNALNCFVGHYNIIKTSYLLGYNKILVFEDDVKFLDGLDFDEILNKVPDDANIVQFYDCHRKKDKTCYTDYHGEDDLFRKTDGNEIYRGFQLYYMDRSIMEFYLNYYNDNTPECADYFYGHIDCDKFNFYVPNYSIINSKKHFSLIEDAGQTQTPKKKRFFFNPRHIRKIF